MREKILAELKKKLSGLSNELLGLLADKLAVKATTDDQIQGVVDELEKSPIPVTEFATFLQKEGDRRATAAQQTHERTLREKFDFKEKSKSAESASAEGKDQNADDDEIKSEVAALRKKLDDLEKKEQRQKVQDAFMKKVEEKKLPLALTKGRVAESEDQIDALITEMEKDYTEIRQGVSNGSLSSIAKPLGSEGRSDNVEADITAWASADKK